MYNRSHHEREDEMKIPKQAYTAEFKELAVTRVKDGMTAGAAAKELGLIEQTLRNWVKATAAGRLNGAGAKVVTPEQMELSRLRAENVRLKRENEILKKATAYFEGTSCEVRLDGGAAHGLHPGRDVWGTCGERSGYRAWKQGGTPDRTRLTDAQMLTWIRAIHEELKGAYGSPRMVRELRGRGFPASKERVERLMREHGIRARHKRRYKVTTDSKHNLCRWPRTC